MELTISYYPKKLGGGAIKPPPYHIPHFVRYPWRGM